MEEAINRPKDFPSRFKAWQIGVYVLTFAAFCLFIAIVYQTQLTDVERLYLPVYAESWWHGLPLDGESQYKYVSVVDQNNSYRIAVEGEVRQVIQTDGRRVYELTHTGKDEGLVRLDAKRINRDDRQFNAELAHYVYDDETLWDFTAHSTYGALIILCLGLIIAIPRDNARADIRRNGLILSGPELIRIKEFNRRLKSDGIGFINKESWWYKLLHRVNYSMLRIPRKKERQHVLVLSDSGQGKSVLIIQSLLQIRERGEAAIIYDPSREYIEKFFDAETDIILNPTDNRSPSWTPGLEAENEAEALAVAASLFPEQGERNKFFVDATRNIFAYLIKSKPSPQELYRWMCNEGEIERRVAGTEMAMSVDRSAGPQRVGVLSSLNMAGRMLKILPLQSEATKTWSAAEWTKQRKGWIFITAKATEQELIQPLISCWIDLLILRLLNEGHTDKPPVWLVLDEAADLKHLAQLQKALTQSRKSNCPIILGFQSKDQVEAFYDKLGKALLSQPQTRIYLRTSEPEAAEWISKSIGEIKVKHLRETWSIGADGKRSYSSTIDPPKLEPLVPYSTITGLPELTGYLKYGNFVVQFNTVPVNLPKVCEGYVERVLENLHEECTSQDADVELLAPDAHHNNEYFFE
jgi:hypothetical protein